MHRSIDEEKFATEIKDHCRISLLNDVRFNISELLNNLKPLDPPDFVCNEHLFEKFEVDAYEKFITRKGKKASIQKRNVDQMRSRVNSPQDIFQTISFRTPLELSNTNHLKKNINDMIEQKTNKLDQYSKAYPAGIFRHIIIELITRIDVFTDKEGDFFDRVTDRQDLFKVKYQVYRDKSFIRTIHENYRNDWDLILFVENIYIKGEKFFLVHCLDLKSSIKDEKMINYPETIFQIRIGSAHCITLKKCRTTNIRYKSDIIPNSIRNIDATSIKINDITLYKHETYDSVYVSDDSMFYFETSQLACAVDPDLQGEKLRLYIQYLVDDFLRISYDGNEYILYRETPLSSFYANDGVFVYFKKDSNLAYVFKE